MDLVQDYSTPLAAGPSPPPVTSLGHAILRTLAYSDLFDYPLTVEEVWRYQAGTEFTLPEIADALASDLLLEHHISTDGRFYCLRGREVVLATRTARAKASLPVWRRARAYGRIVSRLPFVRMVAVTGALAMNNLGDDLPDIDFLVVTEAGRVWICRRFIVGLVRLARVAGDDLCPNYILADSRLELDQRDLFTAHELAQMVPLAGPRVYREMLARNSWARDYLPVAFREPLDLLERSKRRLIGRAVERILRARPLNNWEAWEMRRLRKRLRPMLGDDAEVVCSPEECKGHTGHHRHWITMKYQERLAALGLSDQTAT